MMYSCEGKKLPQTYLEALEQLVEQEKERLALEAELSKEKARADENQVAKDLQDQLTIRKIGHKLGRAAKCLNIEGLGRNKLFKFLREIGVLFYDCDGYNSVKQRYINQKYFFEYLDEQYEYPVIYISPKGMRYVLRELINYGYEPQITAEEWERKCQLDQYQEEEEE